MLKYNGSILKVSNGASVIGSITPTLPYPEDMDFIYQAKDFDGSKIPNKVQGSTFGDYLEAGTLTLNGTGAEAYLSNGLSDSNYLYKDLTTAQLDAFKAVNSTYTYFIRVLQQTSSLGGIVSFRINNGNDYVYMIRANSQQLQIHTTSGNNCGSDFSLTTDRVYKVMVSGSSFKAYNLDNNAEYSLTYSTNRNMSARMLSFSAFQGNNAESNLSRFYALAGIPRATTAEEDTKIKNLLMNQSL